MKLIGTFILAAALATHVFAQQQVTFTARVLGCPEGVRISLFELNGLASKSIMEVSVTPGTPDTYQFTMPAGTPKIYGLGTDQENSMQIILGKESGFTVWANCEKMAFARTIGSEANSKLENVLKEIRTQNEALVKYRTEYNALKSIGHDATKYLVLIAETDAAKKKALNEAKSLGNLQAQIAGLATQYSFEKNTDGFETEAGYLSRVYFQNVNLKDPVINEIPQVYQAFRSFVEETGRAPGGNNEMKNVIAGALKQIPDGSPAYRTAMGGVISGLKTLNSPLFFEYATEYITKYKSQDKGDITRLDAELNKNRTFIAGMVAPDLAGPTPEGASKSLYAMRGKVILVDFWASWCGPCRRENPAVKAVYDKYKEKGFDILGVSLDKTKDAWVNAIAQDGLPWHHISDLKGWQSDHAALYSVTSIPQTILIDRDGKIIERNLRGPALEAKLKSIFGE
jgi:thiol-disulfide isomerase/thioredoxin